jgi:hypothetical protein
LRPLALSHRRYIRIRLDDLFSCRSIRGRSGFIGERVERGLSALSFYRHVESYEEQEQGTEKQERGERGAHGPGSVWESFFSTPQAYRGPTTLSIRWSGYRDSVVLKGSPTRGESQ